MKKRKKLIAVSSILAVGIPLLAIGTGTIIKKVRDDYYKNQKDQIEVEKAREEAERQRKLAEEKALTEKKIVQNKSEIEKYVIEKKPEKKPQITETKPNVVKEKRERVSIANSAPVYEPVQAPIVRRELTKEEIKRAKKALKEARASYFSGSKGATFAKAPKTPDKIIIINNGRGNIEVAKHTPKEKNDKADRVLKEIRDSYYKDRGKK
ncbi:hypothetical protein AB8B23_06640 [Leptotrichia sp. HSP-342]|uniref:Uncharacterized protein n=1 Tax=Leptotrichia mesophila TaxID=3239303 RepID=A0AB39V860_9FUSO